MLQDNLSKIMYVFMLAILLALPIKAMAGNGGPGALPILEQTDTGESRLVAYFDTRDRDSFIQVTNVSSSRINIHVQIFDVMGTVIECEELNFDDVLTPNDTVVYDVENLVTNTGIDVADIQSGTYGFMVVSLEGNNGVPPGSDGRGGYLWTGGPLIGMFRIVDGLGYEYRTNAVGQSDLLEHQGHKIEFSTSDSEHDGGVEFGRPLVNFSEANGNNLSDLVGITYVSINPGTVYASPGVASVFGSPEDTILIYDEVEFDTSCSQTVFACAVGLMNKGIDNSIPNSKGQVNRVCGTNVLDSNTAGWLDMPFTTFFIVDPFVSGECGPTPHFVGFIGLNNGNGTGSMDSWWSNAFVHGLEPICHEG